MKLLLPLGIFIIVHWIQLIIWHYSCVWFVATVCTGPRLSMRLRSFMNEGCSIMWFVMDLNNTIWIMHSFWYLNVWFINDWLIVFWCSLSLFGVTTWILFKNMIQWCVIVHLLVFQRQEVFLSVHLLQLVCILLKASNYGKHTGHSSKLYFLLLMTLTFRSQLFHLISLYSYWNIEIYVNVLNPDSISWCHSHYVAKQKNSSL